MMQDQFEKEIKDILNILKPLEVYRHWVTFDAVTFYWGNGQIEISYAPQVEGFKCTVNYADNRQIEQTYLFSADLYPYLERLVERELPILKEMRNTEALRQELNTKINGDLQILRLFGDGETTIAINNPTVNCKIKINLTAQNLPQIAQICQKLDLSFKELTHANSNS